jgi:hypothetical protein
MENKMNLMMRKGWGGNEVLVIASGAMTRRPKVRGVEEERQRQNLEVRTTLRRCLET